MARDRVELESAAFGAVVSFLRVYHGWTQLELAERAGTGKTRISTWENGKQKPRPDSVQKLARAFGVPAASLYGLQHALWSYVRSHPTDFEGLLRDASGPGEVREPPVHYEVGEPKALDRRWRELARDGGAVEERKILLLRDTLFRNPEPGDDEPSS